MNTTQINRKPVRNKCRFLLAVFAAAALTFSAQAVDLTWSVTGSDLNGKNVYLVNAVVFNSTSISSEDAIRDISLSSGTVKKKGMQYRASETVTGLSNVAHYIVIVGISEYALYEVKADLMCESGSGPVQVAINSSSGLTYKSYDSLDSESGGDNLGDAGSGDAGSAGVAFTITAPTGVTVEWKTQDAPEWTAYTSGTSAEEGEIHIRLTDGNRCEEFVETLSSDENAFDYSYWRVSTDVSVAAGKFSLIGVQYCSTTTSGEINLNDLISGITTPGSIDNILAAPQIQKLKSDGAGYKHYFYVSDAVDADGETVTGPRWADLNGAVADEDDITFPLGSGFWFKSPTATTITLSGAKCQDASVTVSFPNSRYYIMANPYAAKLNLRDVQTTGVTPGEYDSDFAGASDIMVQNSYGNYDMYYYISDATDEWDDPVGYNMWSDADGYELLNFQTGLCQAFWIKGNNAGSLTFTNPEFNVGGNED